MPSKPQPLPSLADVRKSIGILKAETFPSFADFKDIEAFKQFFYTKFKKHFDNDMLYLKVYVKDLDYRLYRVRARSEINDLTSISEYSYPPRDKCNINRANLPGSPVFYSSTRPAIALLETLRRIDAKRDRNNEYCVSQWTIKTKREFIVSPFIHDAVHEGYQELSKIIFDKRIPELYSNTTFQQDQDSFKEILKYMSASFVAEQEGNYSLSAFIGHGHLHLGGTLQTDFFIYPSIAADKREVNIAVNPTTVDNDLRMESMLIVKVGDLGLNNNRMQIDDIMGYGRNENGRIVARTVDKSKPDLDPECIQILQSHGI